MYLSAALKQKYNKQDLASIFSWYFVENILNVFIIQNVTDYVLANEWSQHHSIKKHMKSSLLSDITCCKSAFVWIHMRPETGNSPLPCLEEAEILRTQISALSMSTTILRLNDFVFFKLMLLASLSRITSSTVNLPEPRRTCGLTRSLPAVRELPSNGFNQAKKTGFVFSY